MRPNRWVRVRGIRCAVLAILAAGCLFTPTCMSRARDALFLGTQNFVFSLLDPSPFLDALSTTGSGN